LTLNNAAAFDRFGGSVSISGNTVVVGVVGEDEGGTDSGSVYVYTRSGTVWSQTQEMTADVPAAGDFFGTSVSVSGDTVIIGASGNDDGGGGAGSAYVFRTTLDAEKVLQASDWFNSVLLNGASAPPFTGLKLGDSMSYRFTVKNIGALDLDIHGITLTGTNAGHFSLVLPDRSLFSDLGSGESLDYTIIFQPLGSVSSELDATVTITSDGSLTELSFNISGLALSLESDSDGDGINDLAEYHLSGLGFDWQRSQPNRVDDYYEFSSLTGLFTKEEAGGITVGTTVVDIDSTTNTAGVVIGLQESSDLQNYTPINADPSKLSIDNTGRILYEIEAADGKKFYRAGVSGR